MDEALERMFLICQQMTGVEVSEQARIDSAAHLRQLCDSGETDSERLTIKGLTFLKQGAR